MNLSKAERRYKEDPAFNSLVKHMVYMAQDLQFSPGELREAAVFAEMIVQRDIMFRRAAEGYRVTAEEARGMMMEDFKAPTPPR